MSDEDFKTGAAAELEKAGFVPMPDRSKADETPEDLTAREAAAEISEPEAPIVIRTFMDENGDPAPANEAITLERAARNLAEMKRQDVKEAEDAEIAKTRAQHEPAPPPEPVPVKEGDLDPDLEKTLNHPQVREAIQAQIAETETTRQNYLNSIDAAASMAQIAFLNQFPEFAGVSEEQRAAVASAIKQHAPQRWAQIEATVMNSGKLFEQQAAAHKQATEKEQADFKTYAAQEDAKFDAGMKNVPIAKQKAALAEIVAGAKAEGMSEADLFRLISTNKVLRSATFQKIMFEAGAYRAMQKAPKAVPTPPKAPPALKPSAGAPRVAAADANISTLSSKLSRSGSIKDAVALYQARQTKGNR